MAQQYSFYNLDDLKRLPILTVCQTFGIPVTEQRGKRGKYWCNIRNERTPSALIHLDNNTFYDFGISKGGDVIQLISDFQGVDRKTAIGRLAEAFGISPNDPRKGIDGNGLSDWEYSQIGLHADMATKNFTFDFEQQSLEEIQELSTKYAIPMNELKKRHSMTFKQLLIDKALPYVRDLRNSYYLELFHEFVFRKAVAGDIPMESLLQKLPNFDEQIRKLQNSERILGRACDGTSIKAWPVGEYEAAADIQKILAGEIKPKFGNIDYTGLKDAAEKNNTKIKYASADYMKFAASIEIDQFTHSAFLKNGTLVVAYLESDLEAIKPVLETMKDPSKKKLDQQINAARHKQSAGSGYQYRKEKINSGEGR